MGTEAGGPYTNGHIGQGGARQEVGKLPPHMLTPVLPQHHHHTCTLGWEGGAGGGGIVVKKRNYLGY